MHPDVPGRLTPRGRWLVVGLPCLLLGAMLMHPAVPGIVRSHLPNSTNVRSFGYLAHAASYALLACVAFALLRPSSARSVILIAAGIALHGALTEAAQNWIPTRDCDPFDLLANLGGIICVVLAYVVMIPRSPVESLVEGAGQSHGSGRNC